MNTMATMKRASLGSLPLAWLAFALPAAAAPPALLAVQGRLENAAGITVSGTYALTFTLHDSPSGAEALFTEDLLGVTVEEGIFSVRLGAKTALPTAEIAAIDALWVGVAIDGGAELGRTRLVSVPYALSAAFSTQAGSAKHALTADSATTATTATTADSAKTALTADSATNATNAESAKHALTADSATTAATATSAATATTAGTATVALGLSCVGCVTSQALGLPACAAGSYLVTTTDGLECRTFGTCANGSPATLGPNGPSCLTGLTLGASLAQFAVDVDFALNQAVNFRLQNRATEPAPCSEASAGLLYWHLVKSQMCVCTGTEWSCGLGVAKLGTEDAPAASCAALVGSPSAFYWIDPDGVGPIAKTNTHCDMTTDGGGYTLVALWDGTTVTSGWGTGTVGAPSLSERFRLPFISWFPSPQKLMLRYTPTGSAFTNVITGTAWQTKGNSARIAAGSNYAIFADGETGRNGMCVANASYDDGFSCDGNSGQINGAGSFGTSSEDEECSSCGSGGRFWKESFGGCTATTCNASGLVAVYLR